MQPHISFELEIYPYIVDPPLLRVDILTLCSRSVPYSNFIINSISSYDNGRESRNNVSISYNCKDAKM